MASGQWYPPEWAGRIRALASGDLDISTPRRAATVMLLKDARGPDGPDAAAAPAGPPAAKAPAREAPSAEAPAAGAPAAGAPAADAAVAGAARGGAPTRAAKAAEAAGTAKAAEAAGTAKAAEAAGTAKAAEAAGTARAADATKITEVPPAGFTVHMLRRRTTMPFAGGAYAYPGGGVDPRDDDVLVGWAGPSRAWWAERLGVDEAAAQAIVCAAVRETFEEAGVLLAGPTPDALVGDTTGADWEADRAALIAHELSFAEFLGRRGLLLRSDLLGAWARWITPEFEPRRYDTWFFVAAMPAGQRTARTSSEADRTVWIAPAEAAARYDAGELTMLPPTIAALRELACHTTTADVLAAAAGRDLAPVLARARLEDGEAVLSWPGHAEFTTRVPAHVPGEGAV